ncbi:Signal transduction histidine kinase, homodimeric domain [Pseudocohnilembus persalinus]|uniref:Signal transduction histidine kinase, homodimeric domain n=1 Tax=Pseudocohnilembus persalinus TaxID=266149 RepID=A0A0V0QSW5_PSEPJ|nr:Signal transduction histidine kinase, homodimeric domain [Pseudocohnilembus persalinus]|eukprot:KRX05443.1 Signal transduction histidine kinase, homodimeric domain [Pseudocohnilembus persalinus]
MMLVTLVLIIYAFLDISQIQIIPLLILINLTLLVLLYQFYDRHYQRLQKNFQSYKNIQQQRVKKDKKQTIISISNQQDLSNSKEQEEIPVDLQQIDAKINSNNVYQGMNNNNKIYNNQNYFLNTGLSIQESPVNLLNNFKSNTILSPQEKSFTSKNKIEANMKSTQILQLNFYDYQKIFDLCNIGMAIFNYQGENIYNNNSMQNFFQDNSQKDLSTTILNLCNNSQFQSNSSSSQIGSQQKFQNNNLLEQNNYNQSEKEIDSQNQNIIEQKQSNQFQQKQKFNQNSRSQNQFEQQSSNFDFLTHQKSKSNKYINSNNNYNNTKINKNLKTSINKNSNAIKKRYSQRSQQNSSKLDQFLLKQSQIQKSLFRKNKSKILKEHPNQGPDLQKKQEILKEVFNNFIQNSQILNQYNDNENDIENNNQNYNNHNISNNNISNISNYNGKKSNEIIVQSYQVIQNKIVQKDAVFQAIVQQQGRSFQIKVIFTELITNKEELEPVAYVIIDEITQQLNVKELQIANECKKKMLNSITHEIRTPLNHSNYLLNQLWENENIDPSIKEVIIFKFILKPSLQNQTLKSYNSNICLY